MNRPFADMEPFLEFVRDRGFRPRLVVDVGANRGAWTRMARRVFPEARFLLFEPQPEMRNPLDALCREDSNVEWFEVACGSREETRLQTIWPDLEGSSFLPYSDAERIARGEQRPVRLRPLDDLLLERGASIPDLVKLDIQGFELEALRGATSLFGHTELFVVETSLFEFLPRLPLLREVIDFMAERGYEVYDLAGRIRRPVDGALGQLDVAFAKRRGRFRPDDRW
jgi:FkbM family methyltransferase